MATKTGHEKYSRYNFSTAEKDVCKQSHELAAASIAGLQLALQQQPVNHCHCCLELPFYTMPILLSGAEGWYCGWYCGGASGYPGCAT